MGKISWISLQFAGPNWWKLPFLPWIGLKIRSKWTFQKTGPEKLPLDIGNRGCDGLKPGELTVQFCLWHQTLNFRILWIWRCIFASGINHSISAPFLRASCHMALDLQVSVGWWTVTGIPNLRSELAHSGGFSGYELAHSWAFPTVWILTSGYELAHSWFSGYELAHSWFPWTWACSFLVFCFVPVVSLLVEHCSPLGRSMVTMAAPSGACQGVSLWSLKLSGYCATAWWHTVSVSELAACASAPSVWLC